MLCPASLSSRSSLGSLSGATDMGLSKIGIGDLGPMDSICRRRRVPGFHGGGAAPPWPEAGGNAWREADSLLRIDLDLLGIYFPDLVTVSAIGLLQLINQALQDHDSI